MVNNKSDILKAIKNNKLYSYICNNYWKLDNDTIVDLLKEVIFLFDMEKEETRDTLIENLKSVCGWEDANNE